MTEDQRFVYREDGAEAQLVYRVGDGRLMLVHTEVPESMDRGVGRIAGHNSLTARWLGCSQPLINLTMIGSGDIFREIAAAEDRDATR